MRSEERRQADDGKLQGGQPSRPGRQGTLYHGAKGRTEKARELRKRRETNTKGIVSGVANATPVLGHGKAAYHYARKDKES